MRELNAIRATRIVAAPTALDAAQWPDGALALRLARDEVLVTAVVAPESLDDPHAIVEQDTGFAGAWIPSDEALDFLAQVCEWELPRERPAFAQGAVAGLPLKLWFEHARVLFLVPLPFAADLRERMR